jgi:polyphosphate kinase 2 (PPK2 family)
MKSNMSDKVNRLSRQEPIRLQRRPPSLAKLDMTKHVGRKEYETKLARLQVRLKELSLAYQSQKRRAVIVLEGWDAAGKGGVIRRMHWPLDPRGLKVWPISAPTTEELDHHYLYRFWTRVPRSGQLVIFDRSWYGRVLVERIEGYATKTEWQRAYAEINEFERMLDDDGLRLVKIFLHITPEEQLARFRARFNDPLKRWKLSVEDLRNRARWADYEVAIEEMFQRTSTVRRPWIVIPGNSKHYARLAAIDAIVKRLADGVDVAPAGLDPGFEQRARKLLGLHQPSGRKAQ